MWIKLRFSIHNLPIESDVLLIQQQNGMVPHSAEHLQMMVVSKNAYMPKCKVRNLKTTGTEILWKKIDIVKVVIPF